MNAILSVRAQKIEPSATLAISDLARELKSKGRDIISLSAGEPDFDTPDFIKSFAIDAIHQGFTKYTNVDGTPVLKAAITHKLKRDNHLDYEPNEIIVSSGAKQSIYNAIMAILNPNDEAIIPAPYWVSYPPMVEIAEAKPVIVQTTIIQNFKITPEQLSKAITPKTRLLILNSPSNPSGVAYSEGELKALADVLLQHPQILILSDDIYEYIFWGKNRFVNIVNICPELRERTIVVNGMSKAYAMTGWRIGYAAAAKRIVQAMKKIQSQSTSSPNSIAQAAATSALGYERQDFNYMYEAYKSRHDFLLSTLDQMKGICCIPADGAFYLFPDLSLTIQRLGLKSDIELSTYLLDKTNVVVMPGSAFGAKNHIRLSCAVSEKKLTKAMNRLATILDQ
ncbi:pyridoxal phosphate-dependent aminotransferase [Coxiella endosymbiont of Amblyomma nuttalli]|uniref:pyridoxal phosphate-dependent aminotransferase n=1 Tax=Coxiella endosymbiont of Amblyomma nuttalli TaxID=2749996 RepID=UPI001BAB5269|nr:pyridoxal phosphate-dependent aminotransferase [Coxiella endosymbiont of Amblyomma nuttalli]QTS83867.1 Aspartate aminotransferase [Coxiella endosymbiont of Amblyomma nuttalli]